MNRHQRRAVVARTGAGSRDTVAALRQRLATAVTAQPGGVGGPVPESVALAGGPMDGWVVKPTAAALRPGWHAEYAEAMRLIGKVALPAGRYGPVTVDELGVRRSAWQPA